MTSKFTRDAERVPSTKRQHGAALRPGAPTCPLCGSKVTYQGMTDIECEGAPQAAVEAMYTSKSPLPIPAKPAIPACPNYRAPEVKPGEGGTIEWAQRMWELGYSIAWADHVGRVPIRDPYARHWGGPLTGAGKFIVTGVRPGFELHRDDSPHPTPMPAAAGFRHTVMKP